MSTLNPEIEGIREALSAYVQLVTSQVRERREWASKQSAPHIRLIRSEKQALRDLFENLEESKEFQNLLEIAGHKFPQKLKRFDGSWNRRAIQNFFRRSRIYSDLTNNPQDPNSDAVFERFLYSLKRKIYNVTYLVVLDGIYFHHDADPIHINNFEIKTLSQKELESILEVDINRLFYPQGIVDVEALTDRCTLLLRAEEAVTENSELNPGRILAGIKAADIGKVTPRYADVQPDIEPVLKDLVLYNWVEDIRGHETIDESPKFIGFFPFQIPVVLRIVDNDLVTPPNNPDLRKLAWTPETFPDGSERMVPDTWITLNPVDVRGLENFLKEMEELREVISRRIHILKFIDIARNYLLMGFFSKGLDQLIAHISAIEALLGEDKSGITHRLANRLGLILAKTKKQREMIAKDFKELYAFRSNWLHGSEIKGQIWEKHLLKARDLSRRSIVSFMRFIGFLDSKLSENSPFPSRKELLILIDLEKGGRNRMKDSLAALQEELPFQSDDLEP